LALIEDLQDWRIACDQPSPDALVFPNGAGKPFTEDDYRNWRKRTWTPSAPDGFSPYAARHGHASLLIRAGWDVVRVATRMGHSPAMTLENYAHLR
jgi:integrase